MDNRRFVVYVAAIFTFVGLFAVTLVTFNLWVDPYEVKAVLGWVVPRDGADPAACARGFYPNPIGGREAKAYNLRWFKPDTVLFGSSTTWGGFAPDHPVWTRRNRRSFNDGVPGLSAWELESMYRHARAVTHMDEAMIELQFFMFNARKPDSPDYVPFAWQPLARERFALHLLRLLTSVEYTQRCLSSFFSRPIEFDLQKLVAAWWEKRYPGSGPPTATMGFHERLLRSDGSMLRALYLFDDGPYTFVDDRGRSTFDALEDILRMAHQDHTRVVLFIPPTHARSAMIVRALGLSDKYEEWVRNLTDLVAADNRRHPEDAPIALWDFNCYSSINCEPLPSVEGQSFKNYYDSIHFTPDVGGLVLDLLYGFDPAGEKIKMPPGFGVRLTPSNVEAHLQEFQRAENLYVSTHPAEYKELRAICEESDKKRRSK